MRVDVFLHFGERDLLQEIADSIETMKDELMATLQQVLDDLDSIKSQTGSYIAARDAADDVLKATIADLTAKVAAGTATITDMQAGIDQAFAKAEEDKALLAVPAA